MSSEALEQGLGPGLQLPDQMGGGANEEARYFFSSLRAFPFLSTKDMSKKNATSGSRNATSSRVLLLVRISPS